MAQASVLTESDIKRVFRIIETTRHADRNRLAFVLSVFGGMRVGEIAALKIGDVANQYAEARRVIKRASEQTKGKPQSYLEFTVSSRAWKEIEADPKWVPIWRSQNGLYFALKEANRFRASRCQCSSRKSTSWRELGLHRTQDGEPLLAASTLKELDVDN